MIAQPPVGGPGSAFLTSGPTCRVNQKVVLRNCGDDTLAHHTLSGDTHLLSPAAAAVLGYLQQRSPRAVPVSDLATACFENHEVLATDPTRLNDMLAHLAALRLLHFSND